MKIGMLGTDERIAAVAAEATRRGAEIVVAVDVAAGTWTGAVSADAGSLIDPAICDAVFVGADGWSEARADLEVAIEEEPEEGALYEAIGMAYLMDPHSAFGAAAQRALKATFGGNVALIREGGSIPIVQAFKDVLKADTLLLGLALPDCQAHAPNENFPIANLEAGIRLNQALLRELAL
jgi:hypothetical protein